MMPSQAVGSSTAPEPSWSLARRCVFRFTFAYWVQFAVPPRFATPPATYLLIGPVAVLQNALVRWFGHHVLGLKYEIVQEGNGSGDRTYNWLNLACQLALAIAATFLWSLA